jgi:hypothetical protein
MPIHLERSTSLVDGAAVLTGVVWLTAVASLVSDTPMGLVNPERRNKLWRM